MAEFWAGFAAGFVFTIAGLFVAVLLSTKDDFEQDG